MVTPGLSNRGANQICRHIVVHLRVGTVLDGSMGRGKRLTFALEQTGKKHGTSMGEFPLRYLPHEFPFIHIDVLLMYHPIDIFISH